jgi:hypothetical protein
MSGLISDFLKRLFVPPAKAAAVPPQSAETARPPARKLPEMTPERSALIAEAMKIYRSKQDVLAGLSDVQREALTFMAIKAFMGQLPKDASKPGDKKT